MCSHNGSVGRLWGIIQNKKHFELETTWKLKAVSHETHTQRALTSNRYSITVCTYTVSPGSMLQLWVCGQGFHPWVESPSTWGLLVENARTERQQRLPVVTMEDVAVWAKELRYCSNDSGTLRLDKSQKNQSRRSLLHIPKYWTGWGRGITSSNTSRIKKFLCLK